jgi:hypothetical protein
MPLRYRATGRFRQGWGLKYKKVCPGIWVSEFFYGGKGRGWSRSRRIVVVRQSVQQSGDKAQGKLFGDLPNYRYQLIVTKKRCSCQAVWRFYNGRADSENVITDLVEGVAWMRSPRGGFWRMRPTSGWCSLPRRCFLLTEPWGQTPDQDYPHGAYPEGAVPLLGWPDCAS